MYSTNRIITLPRFEWKQEGGQEELHVDSGVGHGIVERGTGIGRFEVNKDLALKMDWVKLDTVQGVTYAYPGTNAVPQLREYETVVNGAKTITYGRSEDAFVLSRDFLMTYDFLDDMVLFSDKVKWRFVNLNEAFAKTFNQTPRTLYVYSNIGESVIVGNSKTDLLREVPYDPEKRVSFYEPDRERFVKVRNRSLEVCEINVAETHGPLVDFSETHGQTTVTLHFRRGKTI